MSDRENPAPSDGDFIPPVMIMAIQSSWRSDGKPERYGEMGRRRTESLLKKYKGNRVERVFDRRTVK